MKIKPKQAIETLITVNERRIESVKRAIKEEPNLIMSKQLQEDICALIVSVQEYNGFLEEIYSEIPPENDHMH